MLRAPFSERFTLFEKGCSRPPPPGLHFSVQWLVVSDLLADEVVFHGEHGGCRAGGDANLGVDMLDVMACSLW